MYELEVSIVVMFFLKKKFHSKTFSSWNIPLCVSLVRLLGWSWYKGGFVCWMLKLSYFSRCSQGWLEGLAGYFGGVIFPALGDIVACLGLGVFHLS